jgi:putative membrane protein
MKRIAILGFTALLCAAVNGQDNSSTMTPKNGKIGNVTVANFQQANQKGNQAVAAVKPNSTPLSSEDQQLMTEVANGGQLQLALSKAALPKVQSPEAKLLAQSEVEEQTGVAAKLKEIATAKGVTLPEGPDAKASTTISALDAMSGVAVDAYYVKESGVNGHVLLEQTMTKVKSSAKDPALKQLADATLPVIRMHLQVSRAVSQTMSGTAAVGSQK